MKIFPTKGLFCLILVFCVYSLAVPIDNLHFYKAPYHNATKSWRSQKWSSIFDIHYAYGSTHRARDKYSNHVGTFDVYGTHNLLYLSTNVPQPQNISSILLGYISDLQTQRINFENDNPADNQTFGQVEFCGKCEVEEFVFNYRQNLIRNFFIESNIPIRHIKTGPFTHIDKSPYSAIANTPYTQTDPTWINFLTNLEDIVMAYGLDGYKAGTPHTSIADTTIFGGWQHAFIRPITLLEYIQIAIKAGCLLPTGKGRNYNQPFSIAVGNNKHFGFPIRFDAIFGLSNDIYFGTYAGILFFSSKKFSNYPVKTHASQNGFIKLFRTNIQEKRGTQFDLGTYLKLDHFFKGLSALVGYSFNQQASNSLLLENTCEYTNNTIINTDESIKSWHQHVLHILTEYNLGIHDFFKTRKWKPRIGLFYDHPFTGKRVIINPMVGGRIGCNFYWDF